MVLNHILNRLIFKPSIENHNEILCDSSTYNATNSDSMVNTLGKYSMVNTLHIVCSYSEHSPIS